MDKYYRTRKSWEDSKSQIGAYKILENAKKEWKEGYTIYDWNGKAVYPEQQAKQKADLTAELKVQLPVIQEGCTGAAVLALQAVLKTSVDGIFGSSTKESLKKFQKNVKLDADGCCGKNTWGKIVDHMKENTFNKI